MSETATETTLASEQFLENVHGLLARLERENRGAVARAAQVLVAIGRSGHLMYAAGAGHSIAGVQEMFYRAGGFAFVRPLVLDIVNPINGAQRSSAAERTRGSGADVVAGSSLREGDGVVVFSNSGINPYPVEIAQAARERGATVIAVTSRTASEAAPARADARLYQVADIVIDTCVPIGDVTWPMENPKIAAVSSLANVFAWNLIAIEALSLDPELKAWASANSGGTDEHNAMLFARYEGEIPELG